MIPNPPDIHKHHIDVYYEDINDMYECFDHFSNIAQMLEFVSDGDRDCSDY